MGYYKDLRSALNSTKMGDKTSKEYKLVMEARKPLMDILFYHQDEPSHYDERIEFIDGKLLSNIGNWGTPGLVKKVYNQICKYRPDIFDGISVQPSNRFILTTWYVNSAFPEVKTILYHVLY